MGENDLARTFRELEEAVEKLLEGRQVGSEKGDTFSAPVAGRKDLRVAEVSGGSDDEEAIELIRRAVQRLKSLY